MVFAQYLLFSFTKEAAVDKWGKGDSPSFFFLWVDMSNMVLISLSV